MNVNSGEDHHRHYELARWAKANNKHLASANVNKELADPVYHSGRRAGSLRLVAQNIWDNLTRDNYTKGDHWSETRHKEDVDWRYVR